jgi:phage shock protein A
MVLDDDLDELSESPETLRERATAAPTSEGIELTDVFSDEFVAKHTEFETFDELVAASPATAESAAELELVPDGSWDEFVATRTDFDDEEQFVIEARDHWVAGQLDIEP